MNNTTLSTSPFSPLNLLILMVDTVTMALQQVQEEEASSHLAEDEEAGTIEQKR